MSQVVLVIEMTHTPLYFLKNGFSPYVPTIKRAFDHYCFLLTGFYHLDCVSNGRLAPGITIILKYFSVISSVSGLRDRLLIRPCSGLCPKESDADQDVFPGTHT